MKDMNKNIQNTIEKVSNSFPSLFSREDVIKLLTDLNSEMESETPKLQIDKDSLMPLFKTFFSEKDFDATVDTDDVELSLGYDNRIEVERVPIDEDLIVSFAMDALETSIDFLEEASKAK